MKSRTLTVVAILLAAANIYAREPKAPPSPAQNTASKIGEVSKGADGRSLFVGHYGETVEIPYGWAAEAELRGLTEIVYFHRKSHDDFGYKPFNPQPSDYKAENFAPMGLMELIVIPKNAPGGLRSLKAILRAKEKELKENGVDYKASKVASDTHWPLGTTHVGTLQPYRLVQTYAESPNEFYILTVGGRLEPGDFGLNRDQVLDYAHADDLASRSLGNHLLSVHKKTLGELLFKSEQYGANDFPSPFKLFRLRLAWAIFSATMLILAVWPGTSPRLRRMHLFGWSMLLFPNFTALTAFLSAYTPVRVGDVIWRNSAAAGILPVILVPCISWIAARLFGSAHPRRVLLWVGAISVVLALDMYRGSRLDSAKSADVLAYEMTTLLFVLGLILGGIFTMTFGPLPQKRGRQ